MKKETKEKYLQPTNLYFEAMRRLAELNLIRNEMIQYLAKAPGGKIHIIKSRRSLQFYLRREGSDRSGKYLSKRNSDIIRAYVQKSYDEKILGILEKEIEILTKLLQFSGRITDVSKQQNTDPITNQIRQIYSDNPLELKKYMTPVDMSDEDFVNEWMGQEYVGKEIPEEMPYYETDRKERVRSKSELNIANALAKRGIPYKYECPLTLRSGRVFYPDFTILDVRRRREIYWEHRGMMDDREYAIHAVSKVKAYARDGIIMGNNLIITEETSANPLGTNEIEAAIKTLTGGMMS